MVDVIVYGDSLPAFTAAIECAEVGLTVRVLLPRPAAAGDGDGSAKASAGTGTGAGSGPASSDWPVDAVRDPDGSLTKLLERLAAPITAGGPELADAKPQRIAPHAVLMQNASGAWSRVPEPSVFGIPAVPVSTDALAFLPKGAAFRAYLDRVKPLLTLGKTHDFGELVRSRFGAVLRERLVDPLLRDRFGTTSVDAAIAAPGLNEAFSRTGSLSAAVLSYSERQIAQETGVRPAGGWAALRGHFLERLGHYGVAVIEVADPEGPELSELIGVRTTSDLGDTTSEVPSETPAEVRGDAALVIDAGARPPAALAAALQTLAAEQHRVLARVPLVSGGQAFADAASGAVDAVQTVQLPDGEIWTVRVSRAADGGQVAHLAGPAVSADPEASIDARAAAQVTAERDAYAVLTAAGLDASGAMAVAWRAAPWATTAERDQARVLLEVTRQADGGLLPIGSALHGDDLAVAVADASLAAIALRRRLLGLAD